MTCNTFKDYTFYRRQRLSTFWTIEDMVYGNIGVNPNTGRHAIHSHFRQMDAAFQDALPKALEILKREWDSIVTPHPSDFEDLFDRVQNLLKNTDIQDQYVRGIGALTLYDITLNIGCNIYPKVLPEKKVYIHYNCVHESAEKLLDRKLNGNTVDVEVFKSIFPCESAMEIEDILCIYKKEIDMNRTKFNYKNLAKMPERETCMECNIINKQ